LILPEIKQKSISWLLAPDATASSKVIGWTQAETPTHMFVANLDLEQDAPAFTLSGFDSLQFEFSTANTESTGFENITLLKGEGRAFRIG
jgi:hypothetical protein